MNNKINYNSINLNTTLAKKVDILQTINNNEILQEWNDEQTTTVEQSLLKVFKNNRLIDHNGKSYIINSLDQLEMFFGLPYTSSSQYAMLGNTNTIFYVDTAKVFKLSYIVLTNNNNVIIVAEDNDENEIYLLVK